MSIRLFYDKVDFSLKGWRKVVKVIVKVIEEKGRISGDLSVIITNDRKLKEINLRFLDHDYYTDVITFDYSVGEIINGEIYISLETVIVNADNYNVSLINEIYRVIIHGVLHLLGYDDKTTEERNVMSQMEDLWLEKIDQK